jgi:SAM-dependent methyltransferase
MDDPTLGWEDCAAAWGERSQSFERSVQAVTLELVERAGLFAGETAIELGCGPGGMLPLLADSVAPGGRVLATDIAPAMVELARGRVEAERVAGVDVSVGDVGWLDFDSGCAGAIISRFGHMFATDPEAALKEARRVLRPGGRLATAVWEAPERNPYGSIPLEALAAIGLGDRPSAGEAGMFRLSVEGEVGGLLLSAGFTEVEVTPVPVNFRFGSIGELVDWTLALSQRVKRGLLEGAAGSLEEFRSELGQRVEHFTDADGSVDLPGIALVASGRA